MTHLSSVRFGVVRDWMTRAPATVSPDCSIDIALQRMRQSEIRHLLVFEASHRRTRAGERASGVLDDRFVEAFAIAGTAEDALAQARRYCEAGTSELVLTFAGGRPEPDMQYLANATRITG